MSDIDKTNSPYADELSATQLIYSASSLQPGECLVGRFEIEALHSQGRYGLVYRAYDKQLDTVIAIKVSIPRGGPGTPPRDGAACRWGGWTPPPG